MQSSCDHLPSYLAFAVLLGQEFQFPRRSFTEGGLHGECKASLRSWSVLVHSAPALSAPALGSCCADHHVTAYDELSWSSAIYFPAV